MFYYVFKKQRKIKHQAATYQVFSVCNLAVEAKTPLLFNFLSLI